MAALNIELKRELKKFDIVLNKHFKKKCNHRIGKNFKKRRLQAQNDTVVGTEYLDLSNHCDVQYNGMDIQNRG